MVDNKVALTDLQLAVVKVLWSQGRASVQDVHQVLVSSRGLAQATVATVLNRLAKQGVVAREREGRRFAYRALLSESQAKRSMVAGLTERLFGGDRTSLVAHLIRSSDLDQEDIAKIEELLASSSARE